MTSSGVKNSAEERHRGPWDTACQGSVLKEPVKGVTAEELQRWADALSKELGLPACGAMMHISVGDYIGVIGNEKKGCVIIYNMNVPEEYCVSIDRELVHNRASVYNTLKNQLRRYKEFLEITDEKGG